MFRSTAQRAFAVPHQSEYDHTQWSPLYLLLFPALIVPWIAAVASQEDEVILVATLSSVFIIAIAYSFRYLRVVDEGSHLAIRYGPLPLFRKRVPYAEVKAVHRDRSRWVDGWGIHWIPGRGWTYNLWGFDCVRLTLNNGRTIRVGTDDREGLADFLESKLAAKSLRH